MFRRVRLTPLVAILFVFTAKVSLASDTLLINGHIYTGNPSGLWAEAVAITGSQIDRVGTNGEILQLREDGSTIIDLKWRTVIPGIVDSHTHMWFGALALHGFNLATDELWVDPAEEGRLVDEIRRYAQAHGDEAVLFGRVQFSNDVSRTLLDRAVSDRPVVIHSPTEHTLWVNSRALELAGVGQGPISNPEIEQYVVRDGEGRPTGVLRETAMLLMDPVLADQPFEQKVAWMREAARHLNRFGITSVTNATGNLEEIRIYAALRDRGELSVRTRTAFGTVAVGHTLTPQFLADLEAARELSDDLWVSANLVKFFSDGAGGPPLYEPEEYQDLVLELDRRGYQIMTHALGADPLNMVLNAYERVIRTNGPRDRRLRIEHAINVNGADVARFAPLGVSVSMQPEFCCFADGPDQGTNVWRSFLESGATLAFGSDWPCTFPGDPFSAIQQSAMRSLRRLFTKPDPTVSLEYVTPEQRLSVEQAVNAYTQAGAYARFSEDKIGTLEAGKEADLAVLSQDIFSVRAEEIGNTQVVLTMVGGQVVFDQMK